MISTPYPVENYCRIGFGVAPAPQIIVNIGPQSSLLEQLSDGCFESCGTYAINDAYQWEAFARC